MKVLITGANGFIGRNLRTRLAEDGSYEVDQFTRSDSLENLFQKVRNADRIVHLAGVNRPENMEAFDEVNRGLTSALCDFMASGNLDTPVIYTSSIQAGSDNPYSASKLAAEKSLIALSDECSTPVSLFRLPNVFGKWCRPDYNSVVATFCHRIAHGIPVDIHDPDKVINLVYIDDVISKFIEVLKSPHEGCEFVGVEPVYNITLVELADMLARYHDSRNNLITEDVGSGLQRALYATYLSYLEPDNFSYGLTAHKDERGAFVEFLKTRNSGQVSYFTARPGVTRGGHYHHTKNEKFLIVQGEALFKFRHVETGDYHQLKVCADTPQVVETVPGWVHDITNTGSGDLVVLLWANEIFDDASPDTIGASLDG